MTCHCRPEDGGHRVDCRFYQSEVLRGGRLRLLWIVCANIAARWREWRTWDMTRLELWKVQR